MMRLSFESAGTLPADREMVNSLRNRLLSLLQQFWLNVIWSGCLPVSIVTFWLPLSLLTVLESQRRFPYLELHQLLLRPEQGRHLLENDSTCLCNARTSVLVSSAELHEKPSLIVNYL